MCLKNRNHNYDAANSNKDEDIYLTMYKDNYSSQKFELNSLDVNEIQRTEN